MNQRQRRTTRPLCIGCNHDDRAERSPRVVSSLESPISVTLDTYVGRHQRIFRIRKQQAWSVHVARRGSHSRGSTVAPPAADRRPIFDAIALAVADRRPPLISSSGKTRNHSGVGNRFAGGVGRRREPLSHPADAGRRLARRRIGGGFDSRLASTESETAVKCRESRHPSEQNPYQNWKRSLQGGGNLLKHGALFFFFYRAEDERSRPARTGMLDKTGKQ
ncbi:hypothetical protein NL676_009834 [Syzygium grande]|nr:hypothetical protein NL676_009834 [Syzygium grande]